MNSARTICEMGGRLACNTLRDLRSKAFIALGTRVMVNGFKLAEVVKVKIGRVIEIEANYIPNDIAQSLIIAAIVDVGILKIRLVLPDQSKTILEQDQAIVSGGVDLSVVRDLVRLKFSFPATGMRNIDTRPGFASGGEVTDSRKYLVGENWPEWKQRGSKP